MVLLGTFILYNLLFFKSILLIFLLFLLFNFVIRKFLISLNIDLSENVPND